MQNYKSKTKAICGCLNASYYNVARIYPKLCFGAAGHIQAAAPVSTTFF